MTPEPEAKRAKTTKTDDVASVAVTSVQYLPVCMDSGHYMMAQSNCCHSRKVIRWWGWSRGGGKRNYPILEHGAKINSTSTTYPS